MIWFSRFILNLILNANKIEQKGESMRQKRRNSYFCHQPRKADVLEPIVAL